MSNEWPDLPKVRPGVLIYQAPAPVRVTVDGKEALLGARDTVVFEFDIDKPMGADIRFDWNVGEESMAVRYEANSRHGQVDVWYERTG